MSHSGMYDETTDVVTASGLFNPAGRSPPATYRPKYGLACWIYLAASTIATLGWLWFLAETALWVWRFWRG
jgi:hypothetical protein